MATNGNDVLSTHADGEILAGLAGNDTLTSAYNNTKLLGDDDNDNLLTTLVPVAGPYKLYKAEQYGGSGQDKLKATIQNTFQPVLVIQDGGSDSDRIDVSVDLVGYEDNSDVTTKSYGGSGNDIINVSAFVFDGALRHEAYGGSGDDRITVNSTGSYPGVGLTQTIFIDGGEGDDYISAGAGGGTQGPNDATINLYGDLGDDHLIAGVGYGVNEAGMIGNVHLYGGYGNDLLEVYSSTGFDTGGGSYTALLDGGQGDDQLKVVGSYPYQDADFIQVNNNLIGGAGNDTLNVSIDSVANDTDVYNVLSGDTGDDILMVVVNHEINPGGGYYTDIVNALDGGSGHDILASEINVVTIFELSGDLDLSNKLSGGFGSDYLKASITLNLDDSYYHNSDIYHIGSNTLDGGNGADVLIGSVDVTNVAPDVTYVGFSSLYGGNGNDQLTVIGGIGNILDGGAGNDILVGGSGHDLLIGGTQNDVMTGGAGADTFEFGLGSGYDKIMDFQVGTDTFNLVGGQTIANVKISGSDTIVFFGDGYRVVLAGVAVNDPVALFAA